VSTFYDAMGLSPRSCGGHWAGTFAELTGSSGAQPFPMSVREPMHFDRVDANRYLAIVGFTLSFLFLLAIVALAFSIA
jgi:hypothetical protein